MIAVLGPGAVLGTELLLKKYRSLYTVTTTANTLVWALTRDTYEEYLEVIDGEVCVTPSWIHCRRSLRKCSKGECMIGLVTICCP